MILMKKIFYSLIIVLGCSVTDPYTSLDTIDLVLDPGLQKDTNGFYYLRLVDDKNQTIHRISGKIVNQKQITKVYWSSNLKWYYDNQEIETINIASYSKDTGEVNTVIAPIYSMKGDTMIVTAKVTESDVTKRVSIILY